MFLHILLVALQSLVIKAFPSANACKDLELDWGIYKGSKSQDGKASSHERISLPSTDSTSSANTSMFVLLVHPLESCDSKSLAILKKRTLQRHQDPSVALK